jgi:predicted nucleic acid-binding protein
MTERKRLVLDANILLRAVFGVRVQSLLERYEDSVAFFTPDICLRDAFRYVPLIAANKSVDPARGLQFLDQITRVVETVDITLYEEHEAAARERIASRDMADWPIVATAMLLNCPVWTEDQDFFGSGIATWTTANIELFLRDA